MPERRANEITKKVLDAYFQVVYSTGMVTKFFVKREMAFCGRKSDSKPYIKLSGARPPPPPPYDSKRPENHLP